MKKKTPTFNLGGSFILTDQNGKVFDSGKVNLKKNSYILVIPIVQIFVLLIY